MKKYNLLVLILLVSIYGFSQNTHSVSVAINQSEGCIGALALNVHENVKIWPNPAGSTITLELPYPTAEIQIMDAAGKMVISSSWVKAEPAIDISHLPAGLYHINVSHEMGTKKFKIVLK